MKFKQEKNLMRYPEFLKKNWTVSALWHHPLAATLNRTKQLLDMHLDKFEKWVTAQKTGTKLPMKDADIGEFRQYAGKCGQELNGILLQ